MNLLKKDLLHFIIKKKIILIICYITKGVSPNDFNSYKNSIDLFIYFREDNINPKEQLKTKLTLNQM